ncbi:MAG: SpoIIE family protein phosphatase [Xanthomonadales bacterium]|nr:hypothetical protein [Xanthomonadales bacterium]MCC6592471.1 SpoIIE family protein phosphatase [Xanthomonadales bacterium]MCE7930128.1 HAMP domain-containing protein [Xanthomonadales bacterium PRO6]
MRATDDTAQTARRRIRFGLRFKVILGLTIFNILGTAMFAANHYLVEKRAIIDGIEQKLAAAARALPDMLPEGYLDRAQAASAIPADEYLKVLDRLSRYCDDIGLVYLYSYHFDGKKFHTTSSNGTAKERASGDYAAYWEEYEEPLLSEAFEQNQPRYGESNDQWGHIYFLFKPGITAAGTRYVAGADITISALQAQLDASLRKSILIGFASFFVVFLFSFWIGSRVSRKITRLSDYTVELAATDFQPVSDLPLRQEIVAMEHQGRDELAQLASSFIAMEARLNSYLKELTATTETKERLRNELRIAGDIQLSMLPRGFTPLHKDDGRLLVDLHGDVKPAKEAGGDLYDYYYLDDDHLCLVVGDVSDKGMPAALFMTVVISILRARATADYIDQPQEILRQTNELLNIQNAMCQFVTLFLGILNVRTGRLVFSDGGHNHPFLCRPGELPRLLEFKGGIALGIMPGAEYPRYQLQLLPGDTLYLYTDGVTDAIATDESFYGEARLQNELTRIGAGASSATAWVQEGMQSVYHFAEGHFQADDITVMALRVLPPPA